MCSVTHNCKRLGDDRIVDRIMWSISDTGKTDGEPALVQVQDRVISVRTQPTIPESPQMEVMRERSPRSKRTLGGNQIGIRGHNWRGDHGYRGHHGVHDPAGCGYDEQGLGW